MDQNIIVSQRIIKVGERSYKLKNQYDVKHTTSIGSFLKGRDVEFLKKLV